IFAGILDQDPERLDRGERTIERLLAERPRDRPGLLAWKAGAVLARAVRDREAGRQAAFDRQYRQPLDLLAQAARLGPDDLGVRAATAGLYAVLADRLPEAARAQAWAAAYEGYRRLWEVQKDQVRRLPLHLRGELLGGLAESAQRTGHA